MNIGVIDPVLPNRMGGLSAEVRCVGCDDLPLFAADLRGGPPAGTLLLSAERLTETEPEAAWSGTFSS